MYHIKWWKKPWKSDVEWLKNVKFVNITDQQTNTVIIMVMMLNVGRIVGDLRGGKEDMTEKRLLSNEAILLVKGSYCGGKYFF